MIFGFLVFLSKMTAFLGMTLRNEYILLLGRVCFGFFSASLARKLILTRRVEAIHRMYAKWQGRTKHGPYHL